MRNHKLKSLTIILVVVIFLCDCTTSRFISSNDDPQKIRHHLSRKDINKHIKVFFKGNESKSGILLSFDNQQLNIFDSESKMKLNVPYQLIDKIELKENKYWFIVFFGIIGLGYIVYGIIRALGEGIAGAGV
jgi:hypothetical protein